MCFLLRRARSMSSYSNISGVTTSDFGTSRSRTTDSPATWASKAAFAVSSLRCEPVLSMPRVSAARDDVANVPRLVVMIGSRWPSPSTSRVTCGAGVKPPLRMMAESEGNVGAACAETSPRITSDRSPGVITTAPSWMRSSRCSMLIAPTMTPSASRASSAGSPAVRSPSTAVMSSPTVGAESNGISGMVNTGRSPSRACATSVSSSGLQRLATTATTLACPACSSAMATSEICRISSGVRSRPRTTRMTGEPRLAATRALKASSLGLATSV